MASVAFEFGKKVMAIQSIEDDVAKVYGEGIYMGRQEPDLVFGSPNTHGITCPCVLLDTGSIVWGFECWWGDKEKIMGLIGDKKVITVEPEQNVKIKQKEPVNEVFIVLNIDKPDNEGIIGVFPSRLYAENIARAHLRNNPEDRLEIYAYRVLGMSDFVY